MKTNSTSSYKRVLIKLSGESLGGVGQLGISHDPCLKIAQSLQKMNASGLEVGVVLGGGNLFRGIQFKELGLERTSADHMGMLATLMNGIALQQVLNSLGCKALVMSALECEKVVETYNWNRAQKALSEGVIVIFVGGTGNPYFTTDTAAALRASEIQADVLLKATKVDGIYNKDPLKYADAVKYETISYSQVLAEKLEVMDATAIALCRSNHIPILIFNMQALNTYPIERILQDKIQGSLITE